MSRPRHRATNGLVSSTAASSDESELRKGHSRSAFVGLIDVRGTDEHHWLATPAAKQLFKITRHLEAPVTVNVALTALKSWQRALIITSFLRVVPFILKRR